jgi:predicted lipid carrier protein YhbT
MNLPPVPWPVRRLFERLPQYPHSLAASVLVNALAARLLDPGEAAQAEGKVVCLHVRDAGIRMKLRVGAGGCTPVPDAVEPHVTIRAGAREFLLLALRREDPDTLFFDRRLEIEGDTALGLVVKNALDRVEPPLPARVLERLMNRL